MVLKLEKMRKIAKKFLEKSVLSQIAAQAFEARDFLHIFLRFWDF